MKLLVRVFRPLLAGVSFFSLHLIQISEIALPSAVVPTQNISAIDDLSRISRQVVADEVFSDRHVAVDEKQPFVLGFSCQQIPDGSPSYVFFLNDMPTILQVQYCFVCRNRLLIGRTVFRNDDFIAEIAPQ